MRDHFVTLDEFHPREVEFREIFVVDKLYALVKSGIILLDYIRLFEFAVKLIVLGVLADIVASRIHFLQGEPEFGAVEQGVAYRLQDVYLLTDVEFRFLIIILFVGVVGSSGSRVHGTQSLEKCVFVLLRVGNKHSFRIELAESREYHVESCALLTYHEHALVLA